MTKTTLTLLVKLGRGPWMMLLLIMNVLIKLLLLIVMVTLLVVKGLFMSLVYLGL